MTENDVKIKKALECCIEIPEKCSQCPNKELRFKGIHCKQKTHKDAFDLINRYETEIERLQKTTLGVDLSIGSIKIEAYKEFAEMLKEDSKFHYDYDANLGINYVEIDAIDNLLKEKVGEN